MDLAPGKVVPNNERGRWYSSQPLKSGTVLLEAKDGGYRALGEDEVMEVI